MKNYIISIKRRMIKMTIEEIKKKLKKNGETEKEIDKILQVSIKYAKEHNIKLEEVNLIQVALMEQPDVKY